MSTKAERAHMGRVAEIGCILCQHLGLGETPAVVHHIKEECGVSQRQSDYLTIPLCNEHHVGPTGYHTLRDRRFYDRYKLTELDLLAMTLERLEG